MKSDAEEIKDALEGGSVETITKGIVGSSLGRTNAEIRRDRGNAIAEDLEMAFRRGVEDLRIKLKRLIRDRDAMFDFSPTNALSLVLIKDLDTNSIREKDAKLTIEIRQVRIELEEAETRYEALFGIKI
jgi:hypothetical protein